MTYYFYLFLSTFLLLVGGGWGIYYYYRGLHKKLITKDMSDDELENWNDL